MKAAFNKKHFLKIYKNLYLYRYQNVSTQTDQITNEFGVQMINEKLRSYLFGEKSVELNQEEIENAKKQLGKFDLLGKEIPPLKDVDNLKLPRLKGKNIEDHVMVIASNINNKYYKLFCLLASSQIPEMPKNFVFKPGWSK
jgi:hypothetical protein